MARSIPRERKVGYRCDEQPGELRARWRTGNNAVAGFMLFFLCGWSVGCYLIVRVAMNDPQFRNIAGAGVFCVGWFFAFLVLVWQLLGRERIVLNSEGLTLTQAMIFWRTQRRPVAELLGFGTATESTNSDDGQRTTTRKLEVRTVGRPIRCGDGLAMIDQERLAGQLRKLLEALQREAVHRSLLPPLAPTIVFRRRPGSSLGGAVVARTPNDPQLDRPSDSRMRCVDEFDGVRFTTRGQFTFGGVVGAAMLAAFWCGITGIFVYNLWWGGPDQPHGLDWGWQFLFLIPFQLVGLVLVLLVVLVLLEPLRAWTTRFTQAEIIDGFGWFGIHWRSRFLLSRIDRIEVRRVRYDVPKFPKRLSLASLWSPEGCPTYSLVPVEPGDRDVCEIEGLTFGEACWMADVLVRRGDWAWAG